MPVIIDGVEYDPDDITRFNGQALHFMVDLSAPESPVLVALTDDQPLRTALCTASLISSTQGDDQVLPAPRIAGANVKMYEHVGFAPDWFWLDAGFHWPNLTQVFMGHSTIVGAGTTQSAQWRSPAVSWSFFEHINLTGSKLSVRGGSVIGTSLPDLGLFGWNDRISSVIHWG